MFSRAPHFPWLAGLTRGLLAVAALLGAAWLFARSRSPVAYYGTPYDARPLAAAFKAIDQDGRAVTFDGTGDGATALFFGFLNCPDVCPLTLSHLERARKALPSELRGRLRVVLVTLDPARDTPAKLGSYVRFFGRNITGLVVEEPRLASVARSYGVSYAKVDVRGPNTYSVSHTAATYLIDGVGRLRLVWDYSQLPQAERVARDLEQVLRE